MGKQDNRYAVFVRICTHSMHIFQIMGMDIDYDWCV